MSTSLSLSESVKLDQTCRQQGIAFIRAELRGVFGSVFCDFGNAFTVLDADGACMRACMYTTTCWPMYWHQSPECLVLPGVTQTQTYPIPACLNLRSAGFHETAIHLLQAKSLSLALCRA